MAKEEVGIMCRMYGVGWDDPDTRLFEISIMSRRSSVHKGYKLLHYRSTDVSLAVEVYQTLLLT